MVQAPEEAERTVAAKLVHFIKRKTVASGSGRAASCMEFVGKKRHESSGRLTVKIRRYESGCWALERLMEPVDEEVSLRYILKNSTRGGSNIFKL